MKMLRFSLVCALGTGMLAAGCGDDDGGTRTDAGPGHVDAGPPHDSGPPGDAGPATDAGPGGGGDAGPTGMCPAGDCDLLTNGCPPGQACYALSTGAGVPPAPVCQPSGTGMTGDTCATYGDCAEGFICVTNKCQHYCCGGSSAGCPRGQTCSVEFTDDTGTDLGYGYCKLPDVCDPTATPTGCGTGEGCYIASDGSGTCITPAHMYTEGMPCMPANDCVPGLACYSVGTGASVCYKYCDTTDATTCGTGQTCGTLMIAALPNLGLCMPVAGG